MVLLSQILILLVAVLHLWFMVLEMFLWATPQGLRTFGMSAAQAESTKVLAQNQGLYNGFLAASLIWGVYASQHQFCFYGLVCVTIAGVFGAKTVSPKIFFVQSVPAILALIVLYFA